MASFSAPSIFAGESLRAARWCLRQSKMGCEPTRATDSALATPAQRLELVREHGDFSLAYTTAVQSGMQYFGDARGYIAHDSRFGYTFVLGDPVAAPQDRERLIRQLVAQHRRLAFCQI